MRTPPHEHSVEVSDSLLKGPPMSRTRVNMHVRRSGAVAAGVFLLLTCWLPVATASPPPEPLHPFGYGCPLELIGTQLVRCDNLTGAGEGPELDLRSARPGGQEARWLLMISRS